MFSQLGRRPAQLDAADRGGADGGEDALVAGAAAEVAGQRDADLVVGRVRVVAQERGRRHDEAGRAEPALQAVVVAERRLDRRQRAVGAAEALDGGDLGAVGLHGEHQARAHGLAVEQHGAGAADAVLAAEVGAGEPAPLAQEVGQREPGLGRVRPAGRPVDPHLDMRSQPRRASSTRACASALATIAAPTRAPVVRRSVQVRRAPIRAPAMASRAELLGVDVADVPHRGRRPRPPRPAPASDPGRAARCRTAATRSSSSSSTATAAPAMAKSPWRRANSSIANPHRPCHTGKVTPVSSSSSPRAVVHRPVKKSAGGHRPPAGGRQHLELGVERERDGRVLGGGVGVGERAADRAAVADLEVADERRGPGQQRDRVGDARRERSIVACVVPAPIRTDAVAPLDAAQLLDPTEVDEVLEGGQPQGEHRDEALAAGEQLRDVAELGEQGHRLLGGRRRVVLERGGLHRRSAPRAAPTIAAGLSGSRVIVDAEAARARRRRR